MLLELNSIFFTLVAVIVGHVEPARSLKKRKKKVRHHKNMSFAADYQLYPLHCGRFDDLCDRSLIYIVLYMYWPGLFAFFSVFYIHLSKLLSPGSLLEPRPLMKAELIVHHAVCGEANALKITRT